MGLSKRERFLVAVLMVLLLWTGFYKFYIEPGVQRLLWTMDEIETQEERIRTEKPETQDDGSYIKEQMAALKEEKAYFPDMSPEQMDSRLQDLAEASGIQLTGMDLGETKDMETEGFVSTSISLEFLCTDQKNAASFVDKINQEGAAMWINTFEIKRQENVFSCRMEVSYCHD